VESKLNGRFITHVPLGAWTQKAYWGVAQPVDVALNESVVVTSCVAEGGASVAVAQFGIDASVNVMSPYDS
jgi:hypothetical protein